MVSTAGASHGSVAGAASSIKVPAGMALDRLVSEHPIAWASMLREDVMSAAPSKCSEAHVLGTTRDGPAEEPMGRPVGCLVLWSCGLALERPLEAQVIKWLPSGISPKAMLL